MREIPTEEKRGLIFAVLDGSSVPDIDAHLGAELAEEIEGFNWAGLRMVSQETLSFRANWKQAVDSFGENYHVPYLHPTTIFPMTLASSMCLDYFGPHVRLVFGMEAIAEIRQEPERWAAADIGRHLFPVYNIFPNMSLTVTEGALAAFQTVPGRTPGECRVVYTKMIDPALPPEHLAAVSAYMDFNWNEVVKAQDLPIIEGVWRSLSGGLCDEVIFGSNEAPLQVFHRDFDRLVDPAPAAH